MTKNGIFFSKLVAMVAGLCLLASVAVPDSYAARARSSQRHGKAFHAKKVAKVSKKKSTKRSLASVKAKSAKKKHSAKRELASAKKMKASKKHSAKRELASVKKAKGKKSKKAARKLSSLKQKSNKQSAKKKAKSRKGDNWQSFTGDYTQY